MPMATPLHKTPKPTPPPNRIVREGEIPSRPVIRSRLERAPTVTGALEVLPRCSYVVGSVQCDRERNHSGGHLYKCAGDYCPGLPWVASNTRHPTSCTMPPGDE